MDKGTINFYRQAETLALKTLLIVLEETLENSECVLGFAKEHNYIRDKNVIEVEENVMNNQIDIPLIRMELNKRLWYGTT
jgi:hypothetical protein